MDSGATRFTCGWALGNESRLMWNAARNPGSRALNHHDRAEVVSPLGRRLAEVAGRRSVEVVSPWGRRLVEVVGRRLVEVVPPGEDRWK